ncbi:hypothetical protein G5V57_15500 [Nordella sp. HKS 07]|uniref:hypothetical protein n=1 Tax=Nordella sp. HKS 07 TaxID=2712222 RepID=UPI0013E1A43B|nr:hypothetical protein [Nordella sp. HKS 07]QIG49002.1 hypothetical protein G5V57_15500 [Nordella sp. HKS 07]
MSVPFIMQGNLSPVRNLFVCLALLYSAASIYAAEPQRWCTDAGGQRAELVFADDGPPIIKIKDKVTERLDEATWRGHVIFGTMDYELGEMSYEDQKVVIYDDRVFWP